MSQAVYSFEASTAPAGDAGAVTTLRPLLCIDDYEVRLTDFSNGRFRAVLPERYRTEGARGEAMVLLSACGYEVRKKIAFEVVSRQGNVIGARYDLLETQTTHTGCVI